MATVADALIWQDTSSAKCDGILGYAESILYNTC